MRARARHSPSPCLPLAHEAAIEAAQPQPVSLPHQTAAAITAEGRNRTGIAPRSDLQQESATSQIDTREEERRQGRSRKGGNTTDHPPSLDAVAHVISRGAPLPQPSRWWCRWWPAADVTPLSERPMSRCGGSSSRPPTAATTAAAAATAATTPTTMPATTVHLVAASSSETSRALHA